VSFVAMVRKEAADLVREKRFGAWALTFLAFWGLFLLFALSELDAYYRRDYPSGALTLAEPAFFFYSIAFAVLALFLLSDGVTKERESGMLPLVGAKPIARWHIPLAKLTSGLIVYVATFVVSMLPAAVLAYSMGSPVIELIARLYVGPFLAFYAFILGLGLLLGVAYSASKVAIGTAAGLILPLFFLMEDGPMAMLYREYPALVTFARYTPFSAMHRGVQVVVNGGQLPWGPLLVTAGLGIAFAALAFWLFAKQEVAA
jgi:ABC-type transport system involved in multi-copper enzyme maturation permease subunit